MEEYRLIDNEKARLQELMTRGGKLEERVTLTKIIFVNIFVE